ncbi:MAG: phenylacetate--CoA ligase family protein [Byssovorax sp.]
MAPRSSVRDVVWPAIVVGEESILLATEFQLEQSQWWSAQDLQAHQHRQLAALLRHARATVPWYEKRLDAAGITDVQSITPESWSRIPLLTRQELQDHQAELISRSVPPEHGKTHRNRTSGSTGEPIEVLGTQVTGFFWQSLLLRDDLWHQRDFGKRVVAIRSGRDEADPLAVHDLPSWGSSSPLLYETGPMTLFYHTTPLARQVELLEARSPHYLLTYPSNARALCRYSRKRPVRLPDLEAVHTYGEPLTPDVRAACREAWGVPVQDVYSCEELGFLALQCPHHDHYHVQSESVLVEILDEQGSPCAPGQVGRVVLTSLHNFAMPLIRYAIGDHAEVGEACPCGRGLPVLTRILGRRRNRVALPDGRHAWPNIGRLWAALPDVEQIQLVQLGEDDVEVRFARQRPSSPLEEQAAGRLIHQALGHPFRLTFTHQDTIPRRPNGKYETFFDAR